MRIIEKTFSYQAALASTSRTVGEKWWMPVMEGPLASVGVLVAVLVVVIVAAGLIWWSKKTRGGRTVLGPVAARWGAKGTEPVIDRGWALIQTNIVERKMFVLAGFALVHPGLTSDVISDCLIVGVSRSQSSGIDDAVDEAFRDEGLKTSRSFHRPIHGVCEHSPATAHRASSVA